jgi:transcriptional regulator with PAS, ATPase and Fis domain
LSRRFWAEAARAVGNSAVLDPELIEALVGYSWPGNDRELQNVMSALAVTGPRHGRVRPGDLPRAISDGGERVGRSLHEARRTCERRHVREALAQAGGHRGEAARALRVSRQGLAKLLKRLEVA